MQKILIASFLAVLLMLSSAYADQRVIVPLDNSPAMGPDQAPVTIVEFIDFQ
ncbi:MAG TPA: hypothetical protein VK654_04450 [Nitrospirota bacterium]|nr:hypothetical protein [Nitrospirota bacterium]